MLTPTPKLDPHTKSASDLALTVYASLPVKNHHALLDQQLDAPPDMTVLNQAAQSLGLPTFSSYEKFRAASVRRRVSKKIAKTMRGCIWLCSNGLLITLSNNLAVLCTPKGGLLVTVKDAVKPDNAWWWPQSRTV